MMNKNAILLTIGLMFLALLGIVFLQVSFIRFQVNLNEEEFENKVTAALNEVANRLKNVESRRAEDFQKSGFKLQAEARRREDDVQITDSRTLMRLDLEQRIALENNNVNPFNPDARIDLPQLPRDNQDFSEIPLDERIDLEDLASILEEEFEDRQVDLQYDYGIYQTAIDQYVIFNDHYLVPVDRPDPNQYADLRNSPYHVNLFDNAKFSPGQLHIYFPGRSEALWGGVWPALLSAGLFTLIILGCFGYVVTVIFQQKRLSEMKNDFINNMTHEFKTPIATISLAADSITSDRIISDPKKVGRFADIIKQENRRMNKQVEKVLQMALIDRRRVTLKKAEVNVHTLIEQAITNISLQAEKRGGAAYAVLEADDPCIDADQTHLANIINNLLDNANKYSPDAPDIRVRTRNVKNGVEITVQDHGQGMNAEQVKHIFDRFYRAHTGNLHDVKGFGLGLSYVKAMVDAHSGTINVKSEPGRGSTFTVWFPK